MRCASAEETQTRRRKMEEKQGLPMEEARPEGAQATDAAPEEAGLPPEVERMGL